jgi:hypothetical protein
MKPIEKAEELVNQMYMVDDPEGNYPMCFGSAIQCSLIAVNEIMHYIRFNLAYGYEKQLEYWNEVIAELKYIELKHLPK